ncbi:serine protease [Coprinopsis sp. MPI-PUGE-AT-0042]|nr:serine protease [Coprinopsis sp. MPI-PUGE-AT-0042]
MRFLSLFAALAVVLPAFVFAAPQGQVDTPIKTFSGPKTGGYIVKLKSNANRRSSSASTLEVPAGAKDLGIINGFSGEFDEATVQALANHDDVEYVEEDGLARGVATVTQYNAGWPLKRISQAAGLGPGADVNGLGYQFQYHDSAGFGVDVYVIDSGIYTAHTEFQGRATWGGTFGVPGNTDDNGHGTHCAGSVGGFMFGVAKRANLIAVKVLAANNQGPISGIIEGLQWIGQQAAVSGRPSVVSMSILAFGTSDAYDEAVEALVAQGVHVVTAAGNENDDAANWSPARTPGAITVGATDIGDSRAWFSNYGSIVDVFAPGVDVTSAGTAFPTAQTKLSGTSMATPHVAGLVAYLIAKDGNISPAAMETKVRNLAAVGYLSGLPAGTANRIAQVPL